MICGRCKVGIIQSRMDGYLGNEKDFNKLSTREYGFLEQPTKQIVVGFQRDRIVATWPYSI